MVQYRYILFTAFIVTKFYSSSIIMEFSSSVVSPSFIHTLSLFIGFVSMVGVRLLSDRSLEDMLESGMTTTSSYIKYPLSSWQ